MQEFQLLAQGDGETVVAVFPLAVFLLGLALFVAAMGVWIHGLVDAIKNPLLDSNERLMWVLIIVLMWWPGALVYLLIGRNGSR